MGNRILKESVCYNERIAGLCWFEEVVFYRMMVNCDDYGRIDGREKFLLARLFPLQCDLTAMELRLAVDGLVHAGLVQRYLAKGREYLLLPGWAEHQKLKRPRAIWPAPGPEDICAGTAEYEVATFGDDAPYNARAGGSELEPELEWEGEEKRNNDNLTAGTVLQVVAGGKANAESFRPPSVQEIGAYITARGLQVDAERFWSYYTTKGWQVGKTPMCNWKSALNIWDYNERADYMQRSRAAKAGRGAAQGGGKGENPFWEDKL